MNFKRQMNFIHVTSCISRDESYKTNVDRKKQMTQEHHLYIALRQTKLNNRLLRETHTEKPGNDKHKIQNSGSFEGEGYKPGRNT